MFDLPPVFWVAAIAVCAAVTTVAVVARHHLVARVHAIAAEAEQIATKRLPTVLDALRNASPDAVLGVLPTVDIVADDDIGTIADAFNSVLKASVEVTIDHARRHAEVLTNLLVSLGRRNQALIDRQLELVDRLEAEHEDPATLEGLFQLDHMLTTMRRNAENLLVLASDAPARRWTESVEMADVNRGAVSEVDQLARVVVEVAPDDDTVVAGRAAVDLSHLIAELADNAASYSSPESNVVVRGEVRPHGYRIWVLDQGFGMSEEVLEVVNATLADGGRMDDLVADRVGFQVVGRLAQRLGAAVRLQSNPSGGLAASIAVPASILETREASPEFDADDVTMRHAGILPAVPRPITMPATFVVPMTPTPERVAPGAAFEPFGAPPFECDQFAVPVDVPAEMPSKSRRVFYRVEVNDAPLVAPSLEPLAVVAPSLEPLAVVAPSLEKRSPGAVFAGAETVANEVEAGMFRRLPVPAPPMFDRPGAEDEAADRSARLHDLVDGVSRGRQPDEQVVEEVTR